MIILRKYNTASHVYVPIVKRGVVDFAVSADWTPVAGDVKISKDGGAAANVTNLPTAIAMGNTAIWDFSLTATELQAAKIVITVADAATKAVEDQCIEIETYGNASAQHTVDLSDSVRMGLTALPNAAAGANGGLPLGDANARVDVSKWLGTAPNNLISGRVDANAQVVGDKTGYTASTVSDKTGYSLSSAGIQAIWDALISALTTAGSIGKKLADFVLGSDNKVVLSNNAHTGATIPTVTSVTNVVKIDSAFKKNTACSGYMFLMVDDTDGKTPKTGLTGISTTRSIDGAGFASCANAASEVGNGWYKIDLAAGDLNGDEIVLRFTKAGVARNWEHKIRTNAV